VSRQDLAVVPVPAPSGPDGGPRFARGGGRASVLAFVLLFTGTVAQRPVAAFYYDALIYWSGSAALFDDRSVAQEGWLHSRGALTPLVYAPAALAERLSGGGAGAAALVQNALVIAACATGRSSSATRTCTGCRA
jgi:hypothetical protein